MKFAQYLMFLSSWAPSQSQSLWILPCEENIPHSVVRTVPLLRGLLVHLTSLLWCWPFSFSFSRYYCWVYLRHQERDGSKDVTAFSCWPKVSSVWSSDCLLVWGWGCVLRKRKNSTSCFFFFKYISFYFWGWNSFTCLLATCISSSVTHLFILIVHLLIVDFVFFLIM